MTTASLVGLLEKNRSAIEDVFVVSLQIVKRGFLLERDETVSLRKTGLAVEDHLCPGNLSELTEIITQFPVPDSPSNIADEYFQGTRTARHAA